MPGGFLSGLGAGLTAASAVPGGYYKAQEDKRRFALENELAQRAAANDESRTRIMQNELGLREMRDRFDQEIAEKTLAGQTNYQQYQMMKGDADSQFNAEKNLLDRRQQDLLAPLYRAQAGHYNAMATNLPERYSDQERLLQRLISGMGVINQRRGSLDKAAQEAELMGNDELLRSIAAERQMLDLTEKSIMPSFFRQFVPQDELGGLEAELARLMNQRSSGSAPQPLAPSGGLLR